MKINQGAGPAGPHAQKDASGKPWRAAPGIDKKEAAGISNEGATSSNFSKPGETGLLSSQLTHWRLFLEICFSVARGDGTCCLGRRWRRWGRRMTRNLLSWFPRLSGNVYIHKWQPQLGESGPLAGSHHLTADFQFRKFITCKSVSWKLFPFEEPVSFLVPCGKQPWG